MRTRSSLEIRPLGPASWDDFEALFGVRGACGGCWCMTPRLTRSEYERMKGEGNRRAMRRLVQTGEVPGVLGYLDGQAVAWCSIEPREKIASLGRSRILRPVDDRAVWSIVCFVIQRDYRRRGLLPRLIRGAVDYARTMGATIVEGYPVEPKSDPMPAVFAYTGIASAFVRAGFREVARRSPTRPIMRRHLRPRRKG